MTFRVTIFILLSVFIILHKKIHAQEIGKDFGTIIGSNKGTIAYSNYSNDHTSHETHHIIYKETPVFTGMKWQCVEYARRWLIEQRGISFGDIDYAVNLPSLKDFFMLGDEKRVIKLKHFLNAMPENSLLKGDLLIYDTSYAPITGHVAVVVKITHKHVFVAEQNNNNMIWEDRNYSRKIPYERQNNLFHIHDKGLISWIRFIETVER